CQQHNTYPF
nr:immunoglobulin light chain junction region [Macaca mulatta]